MQQARASEACGNLIFAYRFSKKKGRIAPFLPLTFVDQCSARGAKVKILKNSLNTRAIQLDRSIEKDGPDGGRTNDNALFLNTSLKMIRIREKRVVRTYHKPRPDSCVWHLAFFLFFSYLLPLVCEKDPKTKNLCLKITHPHTLNFVHHTHSLSPLSTKSTRIPLSRALSTSSEAFETFYE